jgi:hypothetical protein
MKKPQEVEPAAAEAVEVKPRSAEDDNQFFILAFVVLAFLTLPSLLVLVYGKAYLAQQYLNDVGVLSFLKVALWGVVPLVALFGALYIVQGRGKLGKLAVLVMLAVIVGSFTYVVR